MQHTLSRIRTFLASPTFFWIVIGFFIFQSLWYVFSALYPMAFDEAYHFNLTHVFAQQWLPFLTEHPEGYNFNAVMREPSYLFHYLMSFPYRLIHLFTGSQPALVIGLRLLNVGIFTYALMLFRKVFTRVGVSTAVTNVGLLLFTLIPIVPMLAAHINYDNALMLLIAWFLLLAHSTINRIKNRELPLQELLLLAALSMLMSITKYAALPIITAGIGFILFYLAKTFKATPLSQLKLKLKASWQEIAPPLKALLPLLVVIAGVLFFERFGINMLRYQALVPKCDEVLTVEQCMEFGPYERNYQYRLQADPNFEPDLFGHIGTWLSGMWYRLFFMINGDVPADRYHNFPPLPVPALTATAIFLGGLYALGRNFKTIFSKRPYRQLLLVVAIFYTIILWLQSYQGYVGLGRTAALNGRYLLLIILPVIALMGLSYRHLLKDRWQLKTILATFAIVLFLNGGGIISFIVRSNDTWYWPNQTIRTINNTAEDILHPVIYGSEQKHLRFLPR